MNTAELTTGELGFVDEGRGEMPTDEQREARLQGERDTTTQMQQASKLMTRP